MITVALTFGTKYLARCFGESEFLEANQTPLVTFTTDESGTGKWSISLFSCEIKVYNFTSHSWIFSHSSLFVRITYSKSINNPRGLLKLEVHCTRLGIGTSNLSGLTCSCVKMETKNSSKWRSTQSTWQLSWRCYVNFRSAAGTRIFSSQYSLKTLVTCREHWKNQKAFIWVTLINI